MTNVQNNLFIGAKVEATQPQKMKRMDAEVLALMILPQEPGYMPVVQALVMFEDMTVASVGLSNIKVRCLSIIE